jgi:hypothetical protein
VTDCYGAASGLRADRTTASIRPLACLSSG